MNLEPIKETYRNFGVLNNNHQSSVFILDGLLIMDLQKPRRYIGLSPKAARELALILFNLADKAEEENVRRKQVNEPKRSEPRAF